MKERGWGYFSLTFHIDNANQSNMNGMFFQEEKEEEEDGGEGGWRRKRKRIPFTHTVLFTRSFHLNLFI
jgi:hypothetical protein